MGNSLKKQEKLFLNALKNDTIYNGNQKELEKLIENGFPIENFSNYKIIIIMPDHRWKSTALHLAGTSQLKIFT